MSITGTGFKCDPTVAFATLFALCVAVNSSIQIQAVTPGDSARTVGSSTLTNGLPYGAIRRRPSSKKSPRTAALLTGCTVRSNNVPSCPIPSGWILVDAQGFETGSYHSGESAFGGNSTTITSSFGHTGTHSQDSYITHSFVGYGMLLNGNYINSRELYLSYWQYVSNSNPGYGLDYGNWYHAVRSPIGESVGYGLDMDLIPNSYPACQDACVTAASSIFGNIVDTPPNPWGKYTRTITSIPGRWEQFEILIRANTPSTTATDGDMEFYFNGGNVGSCNAGNGCPKSNLPPGNLVGAKDYSTANLYVGGDWGANYYLKSKVPPPAGCSAVGDLGQGFGTMNMAACQCRSQCPPAGNIPYFHIYIDDIIVLKK